MFVYVYIYSCNLKPNITNITVVFSFPFCFYIIFLLVDELRKGININMLVIYVRMFMYYFINVCIQLYIQSTLPKK